MTYDGLDRLLTATSSWFNAASTGNTARYTYDALDNITRATVRGRDEYYCYSGTWQLTSIRTLGCNTGSGATVHGMAYGLQGNLSNKDGVSYTFDFQRNRIVCPEW